MDRNQLRLYRLSVLLLLPVLIQSRGPGTNLTNPHLENPANATKKSGDIILDTGVAIKGRTQFVNQFPGQGDRRIEVQRPLDDVDSSDATREFDDDVREELSEVAGKERNKEELFDNVRNYKSSKEEAEYEIQDGRRLGKEMNKRKNKDLSLQIVAPDSFEDKQQASDGSDEKNAEGAIRKTLQIYIAEEMADQQKRHDSMRKKAHHVQKASNGTVKHDVKATNSTGTTNHHNKSTNSKNNTGMVIYDNRTTNSKHNIGKLISDDKPTNSNAVFQEALVAHNRLRTMHHVPPLQWNVTLADQAQQIADSVATDPSTFQGEPAGENIAQIWHDLPRAPLKAISIWYSEKAHFSFSYPQLNDKVKHFTQMVWRSTNQLGLGAAPSPSGKYVIVVALYRPLGNDVHRIRDNVQRAGEAKDVYASIKERIFRPNEDQDDDESRT